MTPILLLALGQVADALTYARGWEVGAEANPLPLWLGVEGMLVVKAAGILLAVAIALRLRGRPSVVVAVAVVGWVGALANLLSVPQL